jgi:hypothetical protein
VKRVCSSFFVDIACVPFFTPVNYIPLGVQCNRRENSGGVLLMLWRSVVKKSADQSPRCAAAKQNTRLPHALEQLQLASEPRHQS